jgi:hypothetical protein
MTASCKTVILPDAPSQRDEFGIFEPIVDSLVEMISNDIGGKAIGLSGSWGSGKSTVMRMLTSRLVDETICVWHFDAWAHEGDPLRRTFLERLIDKLNDRQWIETEYWTQKREELAKRRTTTKSFSTPRLTSAGSIAAGLALLAPVGIALFVEGLRNAGPFQNAAEVNLSLIFGLILTLSPFLAILVALARYRAKSENRATDVLLSLEIGSLLIAEKRTETETTAAETPDPTSVEFDQLFRELLGDAFKGKTQRRLVLIVDNLDRVDRDSALKIWTALQTFLQRDTYVNEPWHDQVWVLVPHAPEAIGLLQAVRLGDSDPQNGLVRDDGTAFLEKSIQVRIELPRPVLSDWREYFLARLREAFPEHDPEEFEPTFRVYRERRSGISKPPTPREIKTFINDLGAVHRVRGDQFPLAHLAYYVVIRRGPVDLERLLLSRSIPLPQEITLVGEDIAKHVAALMFGTDVDRALQLLLTEPITNALTAGDSAKIGELSTAPGFWAALDSILTTQIALWQASSPASLAFAATALSGDSLLQNAPPQHTRLAIEGLQGAMRKVEEWPVDPVLAAGLIAAVSLKPNEELASIIHASFFRTYGQQRFETQDPTIVARFAKAGFTLLAGLDRLGFQEVSDKGIMLGAEAESFIRFASAFSAVADDRAMWRRLNTSDPSSIRAGLATRVNSGGFNDEALNALRLVSANYPEHQWSAFGSAYSARMSANNNLSLDEAEALTTGTLELRADPTVAEALRSVVDQGMLGHQFAPAILPPHSNTFAVSLAATMVSRPDLLPSARSGNTETWVQSAKEAGRTAAPPPLVTELSSLVTRYGLWDQLWVAVANRGEFLPLLLKLLGAEIERDPSHARFPSAAAFANWEVVRGEGWMLALFQSIDWVERLATFLLSTPFNKDKSDLYGSVLRVLPSNSSLRDFVQAGLDQLTQGEWEDQITSDGIVLQLAVGSDASPSFELSTNYRDAVIKVSSELIQGTRTLPARITASVLLTPVAPHAKKVVEDGIRDKLLAADGKAEQAFFVTFHDQLPDILVRDKETVRRVITPWVTANNRPALEWLAELIRTDKAFIKRFDDDHWLDLRDRLTAVKEAQPELASVATEIAEALPTAPRKKGGKGKSSANS